MAGNTLDPSEVRPRTLWVRGLAVTIGVSIAGMFAGPAAQAQVPPVPDLPPQVQNLIETAEDTLIPVLVDVALQGQAVSNAAGFALRPGCSGIGTAVLLLAIAGGSLPVSPGFISTPVLIFCAAAFAPGPADPVFKTIDDAVGPQLAALVKPQLQQAREQLSAVRPQLAPVCGAVALAGSTPRQVPPPLNRFNFVGVVC